ncbi:hypothetical protein NN6n1_35630 [Shinella zoogloeoides]
MLRLQFIPAYDTPFAPSAAAGDAFPVLSAVISEQRVERTIAPIFRVVIKNPGVAGWMPAALRYAILWEQRKADPIKGTEGDPAPVLLARGRLVPMPTGMSDKEMELTFRCLPPNSDDVLTAAADALRVGEDFDYDPDAPVEERILAEYYDPLFYGAEASDDPESALTARPEVWRWDRTTLALGRTHLIESDVVHDIGYGGLQSSPPSLSVGNPPKPISKLRLIASWTQTAKGRQTVSEPDAVSTYTWEDFISSFPQPGTAIGSGTGWSLAEAKIEAVADDLPNWLTISGSKFGNASGGEVQLQSKTIHYRLTAAYDYSQQRQEILDISMPNGLQEFPEDDDEKEPPRIINLGALNIDSSTKEWVYEDPDTLEVMHYAVGDEVLANGKAWKSLVDHDATEEFMLREYDDGPLLWEKREKRSPMRDSRGSRFLDINRGIRSVRHGILVLNREVLERSQCAEVTFEVPWLVGRSITCNDSARIAHRRLPGGEMTGKVIAVDLIIAKRGRRSAKITLAAVPGSGSIAPSPGPDQQQTGGIVYSTSYRQPRVPVNAFALASMPPRHYFVENTAADQRLAAGSSGDPVGTIGTMPTRLKIAMPALREEDLLTRRMSVTCLPPSLPKQINLRPDLGG